MKHLLHKLSSLRLLMLLTVLFGMGSSTAWADSYTITFATGSDDGTSVVVGTTTSSQIVSAGSAYLGNIVSASKAYYGGSSGLKLGTSSAAGSIKVNLAESITPTSIVVNAKRYNSTKAATVAINGKAAQDLTSSFKDFTFDVTTPTSYIQINASKYCWISSVTVNYATPSSGEATTTTIDASGITNTNKFVSTTAGSLTASVTYGEPAATVPAATVTWSGDDDDVATINATTGEVTLVGAGTVTFTATYAGVVDEYLESSDTYEMTVTNEDPDIVTIWSEDFSDYSADDVPDGGTYNYVCVDGNSATKIYNDATAGGTAPELLINKKGTNNGSFSATIPLNHGYAGTLKLSFKNNQTITVSATDNEDNELLAATAITANTTTGNTVDIEDVTTDMTSVTILWSNGTSNNVRLDNIVLKGSAVDVPITSIAFDEPTASVGVGGTVTLTPTVLPVGYNETVDWESDDESVATVSSTGVVTGVAAGSAYITAKAHNNPSTIYDVCEVTVTAPVAVTGVSLNKDETSIVAGSTETLTATVLPNDATNKNVTWETSDPGVATVDAGVVTAVAAGTATITVKSEENPLIYDECEVTVTAAPGTEGNPYTVAQAIAATPASGTSANVYIRGIVSQFYNTSIVGDGANYRYYISDDGTTATQLLVYKGKKNSTDDFSSADDLLVGDVVTIVGGLTTYNSTKEVAAGNYIVSRVTKEASDLTLTSDAEVELERTSANAHPTSDITWTTSSTGAITCVSSNDAVATVTNAGVITAVGEGSATITISQAADEDYKAGQASVTVNVTDNRSAVVTGIDLPAAQKTLTVGDANEFASTCTKDAGFTGSITYTYATSNASVVAVADNLFSAEAPGTADITITVTPTSGNADSYKPASQVVAVTVNGTNSISLDLTSKTQAYGAGAFDITATVPTANYDGTVTAESSNVNVATVSVDGTTVTVTPIAVGDATITVTAGAGTYYLDPASTTCEVTVTAPEGSGTAKAAGNLVLFGESFGDNEGSARAWNDSYSVKSGVAAVYSGITGYEVSNVKQGKNTTGSTKSGLNQSSQGTDAYIIIGPLDVADYSNMTLSYQWKAASIKGTYTTSAYYKTSAEGDFTLLEGTGDGATTFVERSYAVPAAAQVSTLYLKIVWNTSNSQAIIDEVQLTTPSSSTEAVKLNSYGYATFCSVYPLDGTQTGDYSLWTVTDVEGTVITFTKVTGDFEGGQGVLVKGAAGATVNIPSVDSDVELTGNLLIGTTAPTFVAAGAVYGLSGETFVPSNAAGNIPAGKAYLTAASVSEAKALTFVFVDETTGITETRQATREEVESIFNLGGQRMSKLQRGINIVNGRKVLVK